MAEYKRLPIIGHFVMLQYGPYGVATTAPRHCDGGPIERQRGRRRNLVRALLHDKMISDDAEWMIAVCLCSNQMRTNGYGNVLF